jgi:cytoskeletal protein CcmA (bactofilin family)
VDGDLFASDSITVAPTANVTGDLVAPRISIVEGAMFNGSVHMSRAAVPEVSSVAPRADSPAPAPARCMST